MAGYIPVKLAYNKYEPESGSSEERTPVIFLHGLTASKEHWEDIPQIVAKKTKRKVYVLDARNHGESEWSDGFNLDVNAEDLLYFMFKVGEKKAIIVGHSMGGVTAMKAAVNAPENIEGIIIEDMTAKKIPPESFRFLPMYIELLRKVIKDIPPELDLQKAKEFGRELCRKYVSKDLAEYLQKAHVNQESQSQFLFDLKRDSNGCFTHKTNLEAVWKAVQNLESIQSDLEGKFEGPAHFIYGEASEVKVFEDIDNIKKFFPNAQFTQIEKAGHNLHTDAKGQFMEALLKSL